MKNSKVEISVIITTYNREKNLFDLINCISKQVSVSKNKIEIIICDSNSKKKLSVMNYLKHFNSIKIVYYNCKINHQAFKRNVGIKNSLGKYKIFVDDDCFPKYDFLYNFSKILHLNRKKIIYFGLVNYIKFKENKNLIKYRQSRVYSSPNGCNVPYKNFLTMNMAYNSESVIRKDIFFNNKFRNYGFEDFEFAYRTQKNYYKLIQYKALVYHKDNRDYDNFLRKYTFLGRFGIEDIIKINLEASQNLIYYKLEKNFFIKIVLKFPFIFNFFNLIEKLITFFEKKLFYFSFLYEIGITIAYFKGVLLRSATNIDYTQKNNWYK